jgi:dethiobiotin synthetase
MNRIVVAGIGTGIGKTIVSAILTEALNADYWKPVQAGSLDHTDTDVVRELVSDSTSFFHPEVYRLSQPVSPHAAAAIDGVTIDLNKLAIPKTNNKLIVELAGGLMVPLNSKDLNIDLVKQWDANVILVSQNYLGSINHTLLSVAALKNNGIRLAGIIFNGEENKATEDFILQYTQANCIGRINHEAEINNEVVKRYAEKLKGALKNY